MNLNSLKESLLEMGKPIGLQVEEEDAKSITLHSQISAKQHFDNTVYFRLIVFSSGTIHLFLTFDEIERSYDNFYLINEFNAENPWFRAYIANINNKDFLELHYTSIYVKGEKEVLDTVGYLLNDLLSEETLKYLKPILNGDQLFK